MSDILVNEQAWEFFVYATLGIVPERMFNDGEKYQKWINDNTNIENLSVECKNALSEKFDYRFYCAFMCAKAAYNDLCRTLTYQEKYKGEKANNDDIEGKRKAVNAICLEIATKVCTNKKPENVFTVFGTFKNEDLDFDIDNDLDLIKNYLAEGKDGEKFHFGQVQKWVNMTLKYMYLLSPNINDSLFDVPVDRYILRAINKPSSIAWSKLNYKDYSSIQAEIVNNRDGNSPMEWEHKTWIKQSEKEKGVELL